MKLNKNRILDLLILFLILLIIFVIIYFFVLERDSKDCMKDPVQYMFDKTLKKDFDCTCSYGGKIYHLSENTNSGEEIDWSGSS